MPTIYADQRAFEQLGAIWEVIERRPSPTACQISVYVILLRGQSVPICSDPNVAMRTILFGLKMLLVGSKNELVPHRSIVEQFTRWVVGQVGSTSCELGSCKAYSRSVRRIQLYFGVVYYHGGLLSSGIGGLKRTSVWLHCDNIGGVYGVVVRSSRMVRSA